MQLTQNYINHLVFLLDASSSMTGLTNDVISVFESQIKNLAARSQETNQETRISAYVFADTVKCVIFDKDVLRLPSIREFYNPNGMTALIDATLKSIEDLEKTSTLYGDHSFLIIGISDGANNISNHRATELAKRIQNLPENWTLAMMVPNAMAASEAKKFGFPGSNIQVWETSSKGMAEVGNTLTKVTSNYMAARSTGVRGTKTLFQLDTSKLTSQVVLDNLDQIDPKTYDILQVRKDGVAIKEFVESWKYLFAKGASYYELSKSENVQASKW